MTLTADERARTSTELRANLTLSGLTESQVGADLQFSQDRLMRALAVAGDTDPVDVWQLRDYLVQSVLDAGREPVPFTVLTAAARHAALAWFHLRPAPRRSDRPAPQHTGAVTTSSREDH